MNNTQATIPELLTNKVAIVTGASRGLGAQVAQQMAAAGASVCVNYLNSEEAAKKVVSDIITAGGRAFAYQGDVTDLAQMQTMAAEVIKRFGGIDILVNNALPSYQFNPNADYTSIETVKWAHFSQQIDGIVQGAVNSVQAVLPQMKAQQTGKIINISTNLIYNPVVTYYDYTTAKSALIGLTRNLASELGQYGIRVNLLAGGLLKTTDASRLTTEEVFDYIATTTPLRQATSVSDFANSVLLMASDLSSAITGQSIAVDGGLTMP
ncbi:3-oxoacyl-ACP reductase [Psychrobacter sp. AOP22-C1-22]|uniref:3-oxoacyl-ACP reductase n=1 Tax=unclassified Psychrobacter TaxID=196806 RepID=UPI0017882E55|nr:MULTISPECIES: 3-oxoacyl-ACP reductase [unclassified Psychrobacter]MBE0407442.1 3-oxoacyl-ACP reductase [Psychrobacter sp. FME6]MBE0445424.1 3-oxoacyl-ACP reductase [Psychrobacter sp. FME5]